ncbi:hypothetical protein BKA70DRAFT_1308903 [Coprinopsis sp. MPI-PUGE-AT-0042]|nr:hypothetical protein BKA70DRAFT_1308903 [Coprinopsis sp. MPI-PUGE-AT-0042]
MECPRLPPEILDTILEGLHRRQDLLSFCLAARRFQAPCQMKIFRTILLPRSLKAPKLDKKWATFVRGVTVSSRLASHVRTIYLQVCSNPNADSIATALFSDVLPALPALETLIADFRVPHADLSALDPRPDDDSVQQRKATPCLTLRTIHLSGIDNFPFYLLTLLPNLSVMVWKRMVRLRGPSLDIEPRLFPSFSLPESFMLAPRDIAGLLGFSEIVEDLINLKDKGGNPMFDVSRLRNLFIEFPFEPLMYLGESNFSPLQALLEAVSQQLQCLEVSFDHDAAIQFCLNPRTRALRIINLQRISVILDVDQDRVDTPPRRSPRYVSQSLPVLVDWIKAIVMPEHLEEIHLSLRSLYDRHGDQFNSSMIQNSIMPSLLDLEAYLTSDRFNTLPLLKITIPVRDAKDLRHVKDGLVSLPKDRLEVWVGEQCMGTSGILPRVKISFSSSDML